MENKRPISPHLQIYNIFSKDMTSGPSFLNRITGIISAFGLIYLTVWLVCLAMGDIYYEYFIWFITSWFGYLSLIGFTFAFYYHLINGLRFLIFDLGYWLSRKSMFISGVWMIIFTLAGSTATWAFIFYRYILV
ncbi:MAG: succinate dehydrogenase, cytochrome b556 subunit [Alphaproteobacteria bacterium]|jgi:succinate dehydrogenase / fumarate reductase cytochrome b subunit|nr:succinate dehydrogenase, cytochrome b556 subunit [Alphaproteobacteria bacterium]